MQEENDEENLSAEKSKHRADKTMERIVRGNQSFCQLPYYLRVPLRRGSKKGRPPPQWPLACVAALLNSIMPEPLHISPFVHRASNGLIKTMIDAAFSSRLLCNFGKNIYCYFKATSWKKNPTGLCILDIVMSCITTSYPPPSYM